MSGGVGGGVEGSSTDSPEPVWVGECAYILHFALFYLSKKNPLNFYGRCTGTHILIISALGLSVHLFCFCFFPNVLMCTGKLWVFFFFSKFFAALKKDDAGFAGENGLYPPAIRL